MKLKEKLQFCTLKLFLLFPIIFTPIHTIQAQTVSPKRGIAYGNNSSADMSLLSQGISWWYNWSETPESSVLNSYSGLGIDFVPMAWNGNFNQQKLRDFLLAHPDIKYILGFNEPNFTGQANMTPTQAAANWPKIEAIADEFGLKIVGPAVNYCGTCVSEGGTTYNDPFKYLDDFFSSCSNCRVDYIAIHSYMNTIGALSWYVDQFKRFGKPVWVTEFAGWESNNNIISAANQESFLIGAVDFLENDTSVFRYSWFTGRTTGGPGTYPYIDLLKSGGGLTDLGNTYLTMPVHDTGVYISLPARIEAEKYTKMNGFLLEKTSDVSGFANLGYTEAQDWLEYNVDLNQGGMYPLDFRIASTQSSGMDIYVDGEKKLTQNFTNTGGWQVWKTFHNSISLETGKHKLRLIATSSGFNINWIEVGEITSGIPENRENRVVIYPNPAQDLINLTNTENASMVEIVDVTGNPVLRAPLIRTINIGFLPDGYYIVRYISEKNEVALHGAFIKRDE
jgi:hypothetical protein